MNSFSESINTALSSSLASSSRIPYGVLSFLETEFALDELAQLVRLLTKAGVSDRPLAEIDALRPMIERGVGRTSGARTVKDLGSLRTSELAEDLQVSEIEARKERSRLLLESLKSLDPSTMRRDAVLPNRIRERFQHRFPSERLAALEKSARVGAVKRPDADLAQNAVPKTPPT
jgi:hypothetical protein